jgi:RNA polymerase sigma-70 factor (ECF subfamily)
MDPASPGDDRALVLRAAAAADAGSAYGELIRRYQVQVFNVCYRLLGDRQEAEDAAQETFIRAYERLGTFDPERPFGPWIRRVAANLCLNKLEARPPAAVVLDDEGGAAIPWPGPSPEGVREKRERAETVRAALARLPPRYRIVIELRHFQDLRYDEIAAALDLPLSDMKSHLFRARRMLAEMLKDYDPS